MTDDIPLVPLEEDVTIIITTSPATCHPSTELLLMVLESFDLSPGLAHCRTLLICDGIPVLCDLPAASCARFSDLQITHFPDTDAYRRALQR